MGILEDKTFGVEFRAPDVKSDPGPPKIRIGSASTMSILNKDLELDFFTNPEDVKRRKEVAFLRTSDKNWHAMTLEDMIRLAYWLKSYVDWAEGHTDVQG